MYVSSCSGTKLQGGVQAVLSPGVTDVHQRYANPAVTAPCQLYYSL